MLADLRHSAATNMPAPPGLCSRAADGIAEERAIVARLSARLATLYDRITAFIADRRAEPSCLGHRSDWERGRITGGIKSSFGTMRPSEGHR